MRVVLDHQSGPFILMTNMKGGEIGIITSDEHKNLIVVKTYWGNYQILGENDGWNEDKELTLMVRLLSPGEKLIIQ